MTLLSPATSAAEVIAALGLAPHPEGGHYREIWRDAPEGGGRGAATSILFLLAAGERSHWHTVDAAELWIWNAGGPLRLEMPGASILLGPDLAAGQMLQGVVPKGEWQAARPLAGWSLVSCVVAPAFEFAGFTLAPHGWHPDQGPFPSA